jgi:GrpB-like predicted nucleotidyltransferase (UPF0157 family)
MEEFIMEVIKNIQFQIIGIQEVFNKDREIDDNVSNFIFGFFSRVNEIDFGGKVARLIRYEASLSDNETLGFLGIEVQNITLIPVGMVAWVLNNDRWSVLKQEDGVNKIVSQHDIGWRWISQSYNNSYIRNIGDFYIRNEQNIVVEQNDYCIIANAYYDFSIQMENGDKVEIIEYDSTWTEKYEEFASWVLSFIGADIALRIEHIGSTAIPGMPAKPSIDIAVEVPSFSEARRRIIPLLNDEMWEYWWLKDDIIFYKRHRFMGKRTHYIHIAPSGHNLWDRVAFREYLKNNSEDALKYADLKRKLAVSSGGDWMKYTNAKSNFVNEITAKALKEYKS